MKRILIVEGNRVNLTIAKQALSSSYMIDWAMSGAEVLKYIKKITPELIITDLNLPDINGLVLMKKIYEDYSTKKIPIIILSSDNSMETEIECLEKGATDFIPKPYSKKVMLEKVSKILELKDYKNNFEYIIKNKNRQVEHMQNKIILSFANIVEKREDPTGKHLKRTNAFVKAIVMAMKSNNQYAEILTQEYVHNTCLAASLHDIGKLTISDTILCKPDKLTPQEFEIVKQHTTEGANIINQAIAGIDGEDYLITAKEIALYHHEKWDGTGYPSGISGQDIPLCARIMAVADVFDALISKKCYKESYSLDKSFKIIEESCFTHFDPAVVKTFLSIRQKIEEISYT